MILNVVNIGCPPAVYLTFCATIDIMDVFEYKYFIQNVYVLICYEI